MTHAIKICGNDIQIFESEINCMSDIVQKYGPFDIIVIDSTDGYECITCMANIKCIEENNGFDGAHIIVITIDGRIIEEFSNCSFIQKMGCPVKSLTQMIQTKLITV
jgi:hypothetical protein